MYDKQILNSNNKMKTTWNVIKTVTSKKVNNEDISLSNIGRDIMDNCQVISDSLNNYFLSVANKINYKVKYNTKIGSNNNNRNPLHYLSQSFSNPFPNIKFSNTSTKEIERIINSLKSKNLHGYDEISMKIQY
jgi:hypothetical protein